jgi:hypothetical protein
LKAYAVWVFVTLIAGGAYGQVYKEVDSAAPLDRISVTAPAGGSVRVRDGRDKEYFHGETRAGGGGPVIQFLVNGALGHQHIDMYDARGRLWRSSPLQVDARTDVDDGGTFKSLFTVLYKGMYIYSPDGSESSFTWNGKQTHFLVPWVLDNNQTMKGMKYFNANGKNLVETMARMQKKDGMIWSFIAGNDEGEYFKTAYEKYGFFLRDGGCYFARQPVENHVEYNYVNSIYQCWQASGDDAWMKGLLASAAAALNYSMRDPLRWSERFGLLKRALTIDSWDFQVNDEYTPKLGIGNPMLVVIGKTKFGVFFGDNTGYAQACNQLAKMYDAAGMHREAQQFRDRAVMILQRLNKVSWNGRFFTHFVEEDSTVQRHLGVDMKEQLAQFNAYSINRGLPHEQNVAIIRSYLALKEHLPKGSPGEWYAIYPPFQRGFGEHDAVWQYMNGGVGGHVAGELALGAYENGYEAYGSDILRRLLDLGRRYGDRKRIWFAYTGSFPDPPPVHYKALRLGGVVNKDYAEDMPGFRAGSCSYHTIPFEVAGIGGGSAAAGISISKDHRQAVIPVDDSARCVYLLHTGMGTVTDNVYGTLTFHYSDSTVRSVYIFKEKLLSNWWFPKIHNDYAGVAWSGPNANSSKVGTWWAAIDNPQPEKKISRLSIEAAANESNYIVFAITLADQPHYVKPPPESFGGPDNWAAATGMEALMEGLAGIKDSGTAYSLPVISPRWVSAGVDSVHVTARYAASDGYVSYIFRHDAARHRMVLQCAGNGGKALLHVELPAGVVVSEVLQGGRPAAYKQRTIEKTAYCDLVIEPADGPVEIEYK